MKLILLFAFFGLAACTHVDVQRDVVFKRVDGMELRGDFYSRPSDARQPAVLVVHGGSWKSRAGDMEGICRDLAKAGFVAFNITYRLAPEHHYPAAVDDVKDAARWLIAHAGEHHIDPARVGAWGYSAGSELVLLTALDESIGMKGVVAGGTPADFTAWPDSPIIHDYIGATFKEKPDVWREASPVNHVGAHSPPVFMYHGAWDHLVEPVQMEKMAQALRAKDRPVETYEVPWMGHVAVYLFSQESVDRGIAFLKQALK